MPMKCARNGRRSHITALATCHEQQWGWQERRDDLHRASGRARDAKQKAGRSPTATIEGAEIRRKARLAGVSGDIDVTGLRR
jgi:hypothetical protein